MLGGYVGLVDSHLWVPQEMPLGPLKEEEKRDEKTLATYHSLLLLLLLLHFFLYIFDHFLISSETEKRRRRRRRSYCASPMEFHPRQSPVFIRRKEKTLSVGLLLLLLWWWVFVSCSSPLSHVVFFFLSFRLETTRIKIETIRRNHSSSYEATKRCVLFDTSGSSQTHTFYLLEKVFKKTNKRNYIFFPSIRFMAGGLFYFFHFLNFKFE